MNKNTVLINTTERKRLRDQWFPGIPDDVYDKLWMLEICQESERSWDRASKLATEFLKKVASDEFISGHDKDAKKYRELAEKLKQYLFENMPKYETYAMAEQNAQE